MNHDADFPRSAQKTGQAPVESRMMNVVLKCLKPSMLFGIVFLLLVLTQGAFFSTRSTTYTRGSDAPCESESTYGIGSPISITTAKGAMSYHINWLVLVANILSCYIIAAILSRLFAVATRFRRPALAYGIVAIVMIVASFCCAIGFSRIEWGYYFARPEVLEEIRVIERVSAVIPVKTVSEKEGRRRLVVQNDYTIADRLAYGKQDSYYCLDERLLLALEKRGILPSKHTGDLSGLPDLYMLVRDSGILAQPTEGYNDSDMLSGIVVDALDRSGDRLVFLGLTGLQLSNDHYPYYELVFAATSRSKDLSLIRGQRFFYDVAGIEGAEWYMIWPFLALVGIIVGFPVVTVSILIWRLINTKRNA